MAHSPPLLAAILVSLSVTGCLAENGNSFSEPSSLGLVVSPLQQTRNESVTLTGSVDGSARVSAGGQSVDAEGPWALVIALDFGQTALRVIADDGRETAVQDVTAVRLAPATLTAEFASAVPPRAALNDTIWLDIDAFLSGPDYVGRNLPHPPHANVHDVLMAWIISGRTVDFSYSENYGFGLESIEGHGALSEWCYDVNGSSAELGITGQEFRPGDAIAWHSCIGV